MGALTDLLNSERGLFALVLVVAATVLAAIGTMTIEQWQTFATAIFGMYAAGKTITGAVALFRASPPVVAARLPIETGDKS